MSFNLGALVSGAQQGYKYVKDLESESKRNEMSDLMLTEARQKNSDNQEIRSIFKTNPAANGITQPQEKSEAQTVNASSMAANGVLPAPTDQASTQPSTQPVSGSPGANKTDMWGAHADKVVQTYLGQGKVAEAKNFQEFVDSQSGKRYVNSWDKAMRNVALGNYDGAIPHLQKLYNEEVPDGFRTDISSNDDGSFRVKKIKDADGSIVKDQTISGEKLATMGVYALDPAKRAELLLKQTYDTSVEYRKEARENAREDRRDTRLGMQIDASDSRQGRMIAAMGERQNRSIEAKGSGITPTQLSNNAEIDMARKRLTGMSSEDIQGRTAKFLANGRDNPAYDETLASVYRTANQRKVGDDPQFDQFSSQVRPIKTTPTPRERFDSDPEMQGKRIGKMTGNGLEVMDGKGNVIGHWK